MAAPLLDEKEQPAPSLLGHINKLTMDLEAQIQEVRAARSLLAERKDHREAQRAAFEESHRHELEALQNLDDGCTDAGKILSEVEAQLRNLTLQAYHQTGEKRPAQGVSIRITKRLSYDEAAAKAWALKENPGFLVLDRPGFEAYAKVLLKMKRSIPGILLQEDEKPMATISKEL
jgi:hypothetical protein